MKKGFSIILCVVFAFSLVGCSVPNIGGYTNNDDYTHSHSTTTTTTTMPVNRDVWEQRYFVDEFDMPTDKWYVTNINVFTGTFSNSATENSRLSAQILVCANYTAIMLYEYGNNLVKNSYSRLENYKIVMRDGKGTKYEMDGYIPSGSDRIMVDPSDEKTVINALKGNGTVSFYIYESDRPIANYLFSVETSNFKNLIK